jgi:hypothetical protein
VHPQLAGDSKQLYGGKRLSLAGCMEKLVVQAQREHHAALQELWGRRLSRLIAALRQQKQLAASAAGGKGGKRSGPAEGADLDIEAAAAVAWQALRDSARQLDAAVALVSERSAGQRGPAET